jgi:geranyl-CoA carboxylase alpha subunit
MEMNTRLQVEHPVTEALVGVDLVEWQLRIAAGEVLPLAQEELLCRFESGGHAIEVRLCAEDPADGYLPQSGTIAHWHPPRGVRVDHALASGSVVSPFYDSMIAKLIAHAATRDAAVRTLSDALDRTVCLGVTTNRAFLARVLRHPAFGSGAVTTAFLGQHFADDAARADAPPPWLRALAAATHATLPDAALPALWSAWTSSNHVSMLAPIGIGHDAREESWRLSGSPAALTASCEEMNHRIDDLQRTSRSSVEARIDGRPVSARCVADTSGRSWWLADGHEFVVRDLRLASQRSADDQSAGALRAPMHGRITQVLVELGQPVEAGALLVVMEAMKMEHRIHAPRAGTVSALHARVGEQVAARTALADVT